MVTRTDSSRTKLGHALAKVLGIKLQYRDPTGQEALTRGESVFSVSSADTYVEEEPTAAEWLHEIAPSGRDFVLYFWNLFPFLHWISRYNAQWLFGDLIAGELIFPDIKQCCNNRTPPQKVLLLVPSWYHRAWHMPPWLVLHLNLVFTRRSWEFWYIGYLRHQKTFPSG